MSITNPKESKTKMRKTAERLYIFGENAIKYMFLSLMGILGILALFLTESANNMSAQIMVLSADKMYITIPMALVMAIVSAFFGYLAKEHGQKFITILTVVVCIWYFMIGTILIFRARTAPAADAMTVYYMAELLSRGDLGIISSSESYMSYYPQQIGLTTVLAGMLWVLHKLTLPVAEYHFIKIVYLAMICVSTVAQSLVVRKLWKSDFVNAVFLVLSAINLPYILYSQFLYSEIPAFCLFTLGVLLLFEVLEKNITVQKNRKQSVRNLLQLIISIVLFAFAVFIRKNTIILIIAVAVVAMFRFFKSHRWEWIAYAIVCLVCCAMLQLFVLSIYENEAGNKVNSGVTAKSYFAMGMQDEGGRGPGWYNGFNINTFEASGRNPVVADEISKQAISERLSYFRNNPWYAVKFYSRKISSQWLDGTYASLQATYATMSDRSDFFNEVYEGKYTEWYNLYCEALQSLMYIGGFLCILGIILEKERNMFWKYLYAICIFGGFFFHILWEANSRYIVTYSWLIMPYTAMGIVYAYNKIFAYRIKK